MPASRPGRSEENVMTDITPLRASHYGVVRFGDMECEAVVLSDGSRGYIQRQLAQVLGFRKKSPGTQIGAFIAEFAPKSLSLFDKKGYAKVRLPTGQTGTFFPAGIVGEMALGVIDAALSGKLHPKRRPLVPHCRAILSALATTGEVALIDEATGYQHRRAPNALQELIGKLLRQSCAAWERRFHPDYYRALYRLFGWTYQGHAQNPPSVIGQITARWVYGPTLPVELVEEIRLRKGLSQKHHQWLSEHGLARLETQIHAVTAIARSSASYCDFRGRCEAACSWGCCRMNLERRPDPWKSL
ncbi:P63C domain-containing protein [Hahella aquimaris]|uniref:P63C domain-containing protein n=1 Tax=Hahella sp. HNIBRBA332 TaxID=3015983 RepID=UPI00273A7E89|nr:P63C domain-containing protein [Hahella sp. HNIBRBA332]WLQ14309.1 P63C domain-containing protein [Hahella sp. HNIBRBA332]